MAAAVAAVLPAAAAFPVTTLVLPAAAAVLPALPAAAAFPVATLVLPAAAAFLPALPAAAAFPLATLVLLATQFSTFQSALHPALSSGLLDRAASSDRPSFELQLLGFPAGMVEHSLMTLNS